MPPIDRETTMTRERSNWPLTTATFAIVAVAVTAMLVHVTLSVPTMPEKVPLHFDMKGNPDRWGEPSWALFALLPLIALVVGGFLCLLAGLLGNKVNRAARRRVESSDGAVTDDGFGTSVSRFLCMIAVLSTGLMLSIAFNMVEVARGAGEVWTWQFVVGLVVFMMAVLGGVIVLLAKHGARHMNWGAIPAGEERHWKWGLFYVNRDDPSLMVEKRYGFGYTTNMANPWTWVLFGGFTVVLVGLVVLLLVVA